MFATAEGQPHNLYINLTRCSGDRGREKWSQHIENTR